MNLRTKTFLALLPLIVGVALTVLLGASRQFGVLLSEAVEDEAELMIQANRKALEQHARVAAGTLARQTAEAVRTLDIVALNRMIRDARAVFGAAEVRVLSASGLVLASGDERAGVRQIEAPDPSLRRAVSATRPGVSWRADGLVSYAPIVDRRRQVGAVWMRFDLSDFNEFRRGSERRGEERMARLNDAIEEQIVAFVLFAILVALIVSAALASFTTRRIVRISDAAETAASGDLSVRVEVTGRDEINSLAQRFNEMLAEIDASRDALAEAEREQRELEIARRIQTSVLPATPADVGPYRMHGFMETAEQVGGDYYDVVADRDGNVWVAIGDVSGHGLVSGLVMMMCQVALRVAVNESTGATPSEVFAVVNRLLVENVRARMDSREHMTLVVLRCGPDGLVQFAGGHEDLIVVRADGTCDTIAAPGPWAGVMADLPPLPSSELQLAEGDKLWLYTDGLTEAKDASGEMFGLERLTELARAGTTPEALVKKVADFEETRTDDLSCVTLELRSDVG